MFWRKKKTIPTSEGSQKIEKETMENSGMKPSNTVSRDASQKNPAKAPTIPEHGSPVPGTSTPERTHHHIKILREVIYPRHAKERFQKVCTIAQTLSGIQHFPEFVEQFKETDKFANRWYHLKTSRRCGMTLRKFVTTHWCTREMTQSIFYELGTALTEMHEKKIIHRNISWDNVYVNDECQIQITDFFEAKLGKTKVTGYPFRNYNPPPEVEIFWEKCCRKSYNGACDFFALGVIGYQMAYGRTPASVSIEDEVRRRKISRYPHSIMKLRHKEMRRPKFLFKEGCDPTFVDFLYRLLQRKPEDRLDKESFFQHKFLRGFDPEKWKQKVKGLRHLNCPEAVKYLHLEKSTEPEARKIGRERRRLKIVKEDLFFDSGKNTYLRLSRASELMNGSKYFPKFRFKFSDIDDDKNNRYHVWTERLDGLTLKQFTKSHDLTKRLLQSLFWQLGESVAELHSKNLVHRNLNTHNIFVTDDVRIQVTGLEGVKEGRKIRGYPDGNKNMPPEMLKFKLLGYAKSYDASVDYYSLGVIGYKMAFGPSPATYQIREKIRKQNLASNLHGFMKLKEKALLKPKIQFPAKEVDKDFVDFLGQLLQKNPRDRLNEENYFSHKFFKGFNPAESEKKFKSLRNVNCPEKLKFVHLEQKICDDEPYSRTSVYFVRQHESFQPSTSKIEGNRHYAFPVGSDIGIASPKSSVAKDCISHVRCRCTLLNLEDSHPVVRETILRDTADKNIPSGKHTTFSSIDKKPVSRQVEAKHNICQQDTGKNSKKADTKQVSRQVEAKHGISQDTGKSSMEDDTKQVSRQVEEKHDICQQDTGKSSKKDDTKQNKMVYHFRRPLDPETASEDDILFEKLLWPKCPPSYYLDFEDA